MQLTAKQLGELIHGMRAAYRRGDNAMAYARDSVTGTCRREGESHPSTSCGIFGLVTCERNTCPQGAFRSPANTPASRRRARSPHLSQNHAGKSLTLVGSPNLLATVNP